MCPGHPETLNPAIREGIDDVAGRDFAHGFVEGIELVVSFAFGRPDVFAKEFLSEGLLVIDPPEVHWLRVGSAGALGRFSSK
jgi:hypothetical protein